MSALVLSLIAALGYGISDFVGGLAARRTAVLRVVMLSYPVGFAGMLAVAPLAGGTVTTRSLLVGAAAGLVSGCAIVWFYMALAAGPMSVVSPLTSLLVAGLPLGVGILWGERPGPLALVGAALAVVAVVLVSRVDESSPVRFAPKVAWLTLGSGVAFAIYFVLLDQVGADTGLWPLVASRASASALILVAGLVAGHRRPPTGVPMRLALAAAALDILANATFLYALRAGMLAIVSVLASLYPGRHGPAGAAGAQGTHRSPPACRAGPRGGGRGSHRGRTRHRLTKVIDDGRVDILVGRTQQGGERFRLWTLSQGKRAGAGGRPPQASP